MPGRHSNLAAWPKDEYVAFWEITSESALDQVENGPVVKAFPWNATIPENGLLGGMTLASLAGHTAKGHEKERQSRLAELWLRVRAHPTYARLSSDLNFQTVMRVFKGKQRTKNSSYGSAYAELRLLNIVGYLVGTQFNYPNAGPKLASRETTTQALGYARKLRAAIDDGICLPQWQDTGMLRSLLDNLIEEIGVKHLRPDRRKPPTDERTSQRYYIDGLIGMLQRAFGEASPKIVSSVATMMGYEPDDSTIGRRIKAKRASHAPGAKS